MWELISFYSALQIVQFRFESLKSHTRKLPSAKPLLDFMLINRNALNISLLKNPLKDFLSTETISKISYQKKPLSKIPYQKKPSQRFTNQKKPLSKIPYQKKPSQRFFVKKTLLKIPYQNKPSQRFLIKGTLTQDFRSLIFAHFNHPRLKLFKFDEIPREYAPPGIQTGWSMLSPGIRLPRSIFKCWVQIWRIWLPGRSILRGCRSREYAPPGQSISGGAYSGGVDSPGVCSSRGSDSPPGSMLVPGINGQSRGSLWRHLVSYKGTIQQKS